MKKVETLYQPWFYEEVLIVYWMILKEQLMNTYKAMCRESHMVSGAAATEVELTRKLKEFSFSEKHCTSLLLINLLSFENAGPNAMEITSSLYAEHASGNSKVCIDLEEGIREDVSDMNIRDLHDTKFFALIHIADAACTALQVDQGA